jgi:hypothetical protein
LIGWLALNATGVTSAALGGKKTIANKLTHLLAALSELEDATVQYKYEVQLTDGGGMVSELASSRPASPPPTSVLHPSFVHGLRAGQPLSPLPACSLTWPPDWLHGCLQELTVSWLLSSGAKSDVVARLAPAVPAAPVLASMLELLVDNLAAVKATALSARQHMAEFEKQVGGWVGGQRWVGGWVRTCFECEGCVLLRLPPTSVTVCATVSTNCGVAQPGFGWQAYE